MKTTINQQLAAALAYRTADLSIVPIRPDGSKAPTLKTWERFQSEICSEEDCRKWWSGRTPAGIAVICGAVSGGLELIDFDARALDIFPEWCKLIELEALGLFERLTITKTPKPGFHVRYRCSDVPIPGNTKLAMEPDPTKANKLRGLIETRGEGGYALAPGCPPECHETGRLTNTSAGQSCHRSRRSAPLRERC